MEFEWDNQKNEVNYSKHGIDFADAARMFLDLGRVEREDTRRNYGEKRYQSIGKVGEEIVFVVYTLRHSRTRIISARRAHKNERKIYLHH